MPSYRATALRISALLTALALSGCGASNPLKTADLNPALKAPEAGAPAGENDRAMLTKATRYWGEAYKKDRKDPLKALNYAKNLKAMGRKQQAVLVLHEAMRYNPSDKALASEYGRLAAGMGKLSLARKLLALAEDGENTDWRVLSAHGAVLDKMGKHREAQAHYIRGLQLAPSKPALMNNLALSYALDGRAGEAENVLRRIDNTGRSKARIQQNLALVLGLQGKFEEAKSETDGVVAGKTAQANIAYLRKLVKVDPNAAATASVEAKPTVQVAQTVVEPVEAAKPAAKPVARPAKVAKVAKPAKAPAKPLTVASASGWAATVTRAAPTRLKPPARTAKPAARATKPAARTARPAAAKPVGAPMVLKPAVN